ncbi:MAG TPA: dUTP diphosphatase [Alphaproteobacteria bacterium]|nr:dUTP diphosphatase [Alphaproteobacteria bacterium]
MTAIGVPIVRLPHAQDLDLPAYATAHAAGLDLMAAIDQPITLEPGRRALVATGIAIALPVGYEAQVRPRSGLAAKHGITVLNSPGTIDADYRGEIKVILINLGQEAFVIEPKARIAQLIVSAVTRILWTPAEELPDTARGDGGFGSTGTRQIGV